MNSKQRRTAKRQYPYIITIKGGYFRSNRQWGIDDANEILFKRWTDEVLQHSAIVGWSEIKFSKESDAILFALTFSEAII